VVNIINKNSSSTVFEKGTAVQHSWNNAQIDPSNCSLLEHVNNYLIIVFTKKV